MSFPWKKYVAMETVWSQSFMLASPTMKIVTNCLKQCRFRSKFYYKVFYSHYPDFLSQLGIVAMETVGSSSTICKLTSPTMETDFY